MAAAKRARIARGLIPWNKGKTHSEESIAKIRAAMKGRPAWNKGKALPVEQRAKLSDAQRRYWSEMDPEYRAEFVARREAARRLVQGP